MRIRIFIGLILAVVVILAVALGGVALFALIEAVSLLCAAELLLAFRAKGARPFFAPALILAGAMGALYVFAAEHRFTAVFAAFMACLLAVCLNRVLSGTRTTEDALQSLIPFAYPLPFLFCIFLLAYPEKNLAKAENALGELLLVTLILCAMVPDIFAYFFGRALGKRKLLPALSPKKTVAGAVAGVAGGVTGGAAAYFLQGVFYAPLALPLWFFLTGGLLCGVFGQVGDLFASGIKREAGIKDFGSILPGHGGVLDRVDSLLVCAPVLYFLREAARWLRVL